MKKMKMNVFLGLIISIVCLIISLNWSFFYVDIYLSKVDFLFILSKDAFLELSPLTYIFIIVYALVIICYILLIFFPQGNKETERNEKLRKNFLVSKVLCIFNFANSIFVAVVFITFLLWVASSIMYLRPYWNTAYNSLTLIDKVGMWSVRVVVFTILNVSLLVLQMKLLFQGISSKKFFSSGLWLYLTVVLLFTYITFFNLSDYMDELVYNFFGLRTITPRIGDIIIGGPSTPIIGNYVKVISTVTVLFGVFTSLSLYKGRKKMSVDS